MKKRTLSLLMFYALYLPAKAQFQYSTIPDVATHVSSNGQMFDSKDMAAYSFTDLEFSDAPSYLNVYSWANGGFGWIRKEAGNPGNILDEGFVSSPDLFTISNDIAIIRGRIRRGGPVVNMIVLAYSENNGVFLNFYQVNVTGVTLFQTSQLSTTPGRVTLDANELSTFAVAWDAVDGTIHTVAGNTNNSAGTIVLGCENKVDLSGLALKVKWPDVAIANSSTGGLQLHYVAISNDNTTAIECKQDFNFIMTNCSGIPEPPSVIEDVYTPGNPITFFPKIDCPDHFMYDDWAYVISDLPTAFTQDNKIELVRYMPEMTSSVQHTTLNDGSLGPQNLVGVGYASLGANDPCVGYEPDGTSLKVLWRYPLTDLQANLGNYDYIGLTLDQSNMPTTGDYNVLDYQDRPEAGLFGMAISTQNDQSEDAFVTYMEGLPNIFQIVFYKNIPWGSTTFKAVHTAPAAKSGNVAVEGYPNPFTKEFKLKLDDKYADEMLNVALTDINGKVITTLKGNVAAVNKQLATISASLTKGIFVLNVQSNDIAVNRIMKITKL